MENSQIAKLSVDELFERARALADDDDQRWAMIRELHRRADRAIYDRCEILLVGGGPDRVLACDVLSQLGYPNRNADGALPFRIEAVAHLRKCLSDPLNTVVASAVTALGHQGLDDVVNDVVALASNPNVNVRFAVAAALANRTEVEAIDALERLSRDSDSGVRDWATFTLSAAADLDNTKVRRTLAARLEDDDEDIRCEALVGLAVRGDARGKDALKRMLLGETTYSPLMFEAAEIYADPALVPLLEKWRARFEWTGPNRERGDAYLLRAVRSAIDACTGSTAKL